MDYLKQLEICDILCIQNKEGNFISNGIRWFTNGKVSHIAMYVGGGKNFIIEYTIGGCQHNRIQKYLKYPYKIWVRRIKDLTVDMASKIKDEAYKDIGKGYDYVAYAGYMFFQGLEKIDKVMEKLFKFDLGLSNLRKFDNWLQVRNKEVCSSGIDVWTKRAGLDLFPELGNQQVTPEDVLKSNKLKTIMVLDFIKEV